VGAPERVFVLVLAAGESRRLGQPKQLLDLAGKPLVVHAVEHALAAEVDGVVVVIGSHASEVELALRGYPVYRVFNPHFAEGQGSSLAAGVRAMPSTVDAVVVVLGDVPGISPEAIGAVVARWRDRHPPAVVARYGTQRGHPVLFDRSVFFELASLDADTGGRDLLRALGDLVEEVALPGEMPSDVDTEEDWERLQQEWA
jgi:molybdenum cofactor cytidylyltransferase